MSLITMQQELESFSDQMLQKETQQPSGRYPIYLLATEVQRRQELRNRYQAEKAKQAANQPTVLDQRLAQMGQGIPQVDPGLPPEAQADPNMGGGIQAFAQGGLVGYANGGQVAPDPDDDPVAKAFWESRRGPLAWFMRQERSPFSFSPGGAGFPTPPNPAAGQSILGMMFGGQGSRPRTPQEGPALPENPYGPLAEAAADDPDLLRRLFGGGGGGGGGSFFNTELFDRIYGPVERDLPAMQERYAQGVDMAGQVRDARGELSDYMREMANKGPGAAETMLEELRRSPEQMAKERRDRALAGLGALIGSSVRVGDIAGGMGDINREMYDLRDAQRQRDEDIRMAIAQAQDTRQTRSEDLTMQAMGGDISTLESYAATMRDLAEELRSGYTDASEAGARALAAASQYATVEAASMGRAGNIAMATEITKVIDSLNSVLADNMMMPADQRELVQRRLVELTAIAAELFGATGGGGFDPRAAFEEFRDIVAGQGGG